jgi:hypothetical protein
VRVEIRTSGGFTGRGIGNVVIEHARSLRALIDAALVSGAPTPSPARGSADEVHYTLTVRSGKTLHTFSWTDGSPPSPPVLALFEAAWAHRQ